MPGLTRGIHIPLLFFCSLAISQYVSPSSGAGKQPAHPTQPPPRTAQEQSFVEELIRQRQQQQWPSAASPYRAGEGIYYEEPNGNNRFEEIDEALTNSYPTVIELNEAASPVVLAEEEETMLPQDFGDMDALVGEETESSAESSYFELPSAIGQTAGLAVDANQNLILFHRSGREWDEWSFDKAHRFNRSLGPIPNATIAVLDTTNGKVLAEGGKGLFYMPHGLSIDPHTGDLWVTDVGSHQVMKLDGKSLKPKMVLGEKMVPGRDGKHFCQPTDVAVAKSGEFFVADGYCNSRVMKFDKEGKFVTSFGGPNSGSPPKIGEFFVPHSLVLIEDLNLLCVADRENERIQCFAAGLSEGEGAAAHHPRAYIPTGTFFTKAEKIGRVFAIREKQHYLVGVTSRDERRQVDPQIFVMDMNTGRANTFAKGLENTHALALSDQGDIYVSQMSPNQIVKFSVPREEEA